MFISVCEAVLVTNALSVLLQVRLLNGDGELGGEAGVYPEMLEHFHRRYHTTFLRYLSRERPRDLQGNHVQALYRNLLRKNLCLL